MVLARDLLAQAVEADPTDPDAPAYLSSALLGLADIGGAQRAVDLAIALGPDRFAPHQMAGELALRLGNAEGAARHFQCAMTAAPPDASSVRAARLGLALARRHGRRANHQRPVLPSWPFRWRALIGRGRSTRG